MFTQKEPLGYTLSMSDKKIVIFTDLDGTLLEHSSYSFDEATEMLAFLKKENIPLIITTSKTKDEVMPIQKALGITTPFIVENGAGIFVPSVNEEGSEMLSLGFEYSYIRECFIRYAQTIQMHGFGDMSVDEVAKHTSLSLANASKAKKRAFTEPFLLTNPTDLATLTKMAQADELAIIQGGRFYHLISQNQDKANAMRVVMERYKQTSNEPLYTIGLGDSANDLQMLENVDTAVLIPHPDGTYLSCDVEGIIKAPFAGPKGWNYVIKEYFNAK